VERTFLSFGHIIWHPLSNAKAISCIGAAVIAATVTFLFVERPFRRPGNGQKRTFGLAGAMLMTLACGELITTQAISPWLNNFDAPTMNAWSFLREKAPNSDKNATGIYPLEAQRPNLVLFIGDSHLAQYAVRLDKLITSDPAGPGAIMAVGGGCIPIENAKRMISAGLHAGR
jgi:hypothetical protein